MSRNSTKPRVARPREPGGIIGLPPDVIAVIATAVRSSNYSVRGLLYTILFLPIDMVVRGTETWKR